MVRLADRLPGEFRAGRGQGASSEELGEVVSRALASIVAHDAVRLVGTTPASGFSMATIGFYHRYEPAFGRALVDEICTGSDLCLRDRARAPVPALVVGAERGSRRFAEAGVGSQLRLLLRDGRGVWGMLELLRSQGGRPFHGADVRRLAPLGPVLIEALQRFVTGGPLCPEEPRSPVGVLILGPDHAVRAATPPARALLRRLCGLLPAWLPESFFGGIAMHARQPGAPALICGPPAFYGRWLAFSGQPLDDGDVAVTITMAGAGQLLPTFADWYGITAREREIVGELCDGAAPKQIARRLGLSGFTVNDHLKAVFRKTGAGSRAELTAVLSG